MRDQATSTNCKPSPALQHLVHEWLTVRTSINSWDHIDTPLPVKPKYCTNGTSIIQLSQLSTTTISCLYYRRPPAVSTMNDYSASCLNYFHRQYDHQIITYDKINRYLLLQLSRFCSLRCLPVVNLLTWTTKIISGWNSLLAPQHWEVDSIWKIFLHLLFLWTAEYQKTATSSEFWIKTEAFNFCSQNFGNHLKSKFQRQRRLFRHQKTSKEYRCQNRLVEFTNFEAKLMEIESIRL